MSPLADGRKSVPPQHSRSDQRLSRLAEMARRLSPNARRLIACRAARSVGQGALVVDFALYLHALGWSAFEMGLVYMAGLLVGAGFTILAGPLSDRVGRRPFLIGYSVVQGLAGLAALASGRLEFLVPAAVAGAFGRGANGAAGPFGPVEQAWLSADLQPFDFGWVYSLNSAVGFAGMAAGAGLAGLPALWRQWLPGALAYRPLFLLVVIGALIPFALLFGMVDRPGPLTGPLTDARTGPAAAHRALNPPDRRSERGLLLRLTGINSLNGLAIGIIGPFMALWFQLRFSQGPATIAPVMAAGFLLGAFGALGTGWLTRRIGTVRAVVATRLVGLVLLILLPFAPTYPLAAVCYVIRGAFNRGSAGARQAVGLALVGPGRRGLAASVNSASMQIPRSIGPIIGGVLLDADFLALPLLLAAALQAAYLVLYEVTFRNVA